jgi:hypothetical protein
MVVFWSAFALPFGFGLGIFAAMLLGIDVVAAVREMLGRGCDCDK